MRKTLALILILACAASIVLLPGCGGGDGAGEEKGEIVDEGGRKITVEEPQEEGGGGKVTLEGEGGGQATIEVEEQEPTEESLGAPIYPGADYVEGSGVSGTTTSGEKELVASGAEFTSGDKLEKVVSWYKGKLGEPLVTAPEETTWVVRGQEGEVITVIVKSEEGRTKITIAKVSGDVDISL